ncbi:MAG TPA: response regulator [Acidobacteriaceae bacterium]
MEKASRLLFVDDEPNIRTLLSAILKNNGFTVTLAATVAEALNLIATQPFDVLISDLNIGEAGDGFTVVSAMRRTQPDAATFILTGYPAFETALEAIRQQVDDYFVKPADVNLLVQKVQSRLSGPRKEHRRIEPRRVAEILDESQDTIVARWLSTARADAELGKAELSDQELTDHLPGVLREIIRKTRLEELSPDAVSSAKEHGKTRFRQGFDLPSLVREARMLHDVTSEVVQENLLGVDTSFVIRDIMAIGETIQAFLEESIRSFMQARETAR